MHFPWEVHLQAAQAKNLKLLSFLSFLTPDPPASPESDHLPPPRGRSQHPLSLGYSEVLLTAASAPTPVPLQPVLNSATGVSLP